ncbi:hypothetical protein KM043_017002 [Ampulex compressa]|nr:hypothetical protein KM043_017002 [Ampulex compressa]
MARGISVLLLLGFGTIALCQEPGKLTTVLLSSDAKSLNAVDLGMAASLETENNRQQRSPQFGLLSDYGDYSDYEDEARHLGHKFKPHKHHKPVGYHGGYGCRGIECGGGWNPGYGGHHESGHGGSFATASAGSSGGGGYHGGHSEANAQSASFSVGPYTASFSVAQAASNGHNF